MSKRIEGLLVFLTIVMVIYVVIAFLISCTENGLMQCMSFYEFREPFTEPTHVWGKTLWDILEILVVPVAIALVAIWFQSSERKQEQIIAENRIQEETLRDYFKEMERLFLDYDLRNKIPDDESEIFKIANVITVTTLRRLERDRRNTVFQFLRDAYIDRYVLRRAYMEGIDLSGCNLFGINLRLAKLKNSNLSYTRVDETNFEWAELAGCNFTGADILDTSFGDIDMSKAKFDNAELDGCVFSGTNLSNASFVNAKLEWIDIASTKLENTDFTRAKLKDVNFTDEQLAKIKLTKEQIESAKLLSSRKLKHKENNSFAKDE